MKQTIQILFTILATFMVALITSLLLDWEWISKCWPRYTLIVLLMLLEVIIGAYAFTVVTKQTLKP